MTTSHNNLWKKTALMTLFTLSLLSVNPARAESEGDITACRGNLKNLGYALDTYAKEHGGKYPPSLSNLKPKTVKAIPTCPAANRDTYSSGYKIDPKEGYRISCSGHHHGALGFAANQPAYSGTRGFIESQPSAQNVKNARVVFGDIYRLRYAIQIPTGWMYKSGNAYGLNLVNPQSPGATLSCGDVRGIQDVDQWYKDTLAEMQKTGMKPISPRMRTVMGIKGFQLKLNQDGRTLLAFYAADGEKNFTISLSAPTSKFPILEKDFEEVLRTLQQVRR